MLMVVLLGCVGSEVAEGVGVVRMSPVGPSVPDLPLHVRLVSLPRPWIYSGGW